MKTLLNVLVLVVLSACGPEAPIGTRNPALIADYVVAKLNDGEVEKLDPFIQQIGFRLATLACAEGWYDDGKRLDANVCDARINRADVFTALSFTKQYAGKCARDKSKDRKISLDAEAFTIKCGTVETTLRIINTKIENVTDDRVEIYGWFISGPILSELVVHIKSLMTVEGLEREVRAEAASRK